MPANPRALQRFHFTCLYCRWRRKWRGKYCKPSFWIKYTYRNHNITYFTKEHRVGGAVFYTNNGTPLKVMLNFTLLIDPRGHFTAWRCATIITLDKMIRMFKRKRPFVEIAEFFANYPTW